MQVSLYIQAKPDCRGSNFRELRNLDSSTVHSLLVKVRDGHLSLNFLNKECKRVKRMLKLKQVFASEVGANSWEQAAQAYPRHATEAALERFLAPAKLSGPTLTAFQQYCSRAVRTAATAPPPAGCCSTQTVEVTQNGSTYYGTHLALLPEEITYQEITTHLPQFTGFTLVFMRLSGHSSQKVQRWHICACRCTCTMCTLYVHCTGDTDIASCASSKQRGWTDRVYCDWPDMFQRALWLSFSL